MSDECHRESPFLLDLVSVTQELVFELKNHYFQRHQTLALPLGKGSQEWMAVRLLAPAHSTLRKGGLVLLEKARHMVTHRWRPVNSASLLLLGHSCTRCNLHTLTPQGIRSHPDHHEVLMSPCPAPPTAPTFEKPAPPPPVSGEFGGSGLDLWLPWQPGSGPLDRGLTLGPHQRSPALRPTEMRTDSSSSPTSEESHAPVVDQERLSTRSPTAANI